MPTWIATERLYLDREKTKVVREGDGAAASLLCGLGAMVPDDVCRKWGIGPYEGATTLTDPPIPDPNGSDTVVISPVADLNTTDETEAPHSGSQDDHSHSPLGPPEGTGEVAETAEPVATDSPSPSRPRRMR